MDSASWISDSGTWILDSNRKWDSGLLELYSGLQSPGFQIPRAVPYMGRIGPLQLAIHVVQNRRAGEQKSHWDKTNKENYHFKLFILSQCYFCPPAWRFCATWVPSFQGPIRVTKRFNALFLPAALVDPGHVTIPFCDDPDVVGRGAAYGKYLWTEKKLWRDALLKIYTAYQPRLFGHYKVNTSRPRTWACDQLKPTTAQRITLKNTSPQWVVHSSQRYSQVTQYALLTKCDVRSRCLHISQGLFLRFMTFMDLHEERDQ